MSSTDLLRIFPDGNYKEVPSVTRALTEISVPVIWLPFNPDTTKQLTIEGYFLTDQYAVEELDYGRKLTNGTVRKFEESVTAEAIEADGLAIVSRAKDGKVLARQIWAIATQGDI